MTTSVELEGGQTAEASPESIGDSISVGSIEKSGAVAVGRGATAVYQGLTVEQVAALVVELKKKDQPTVWDGRVPYLGLNAYQESDAEFFFGREELVEDLLGRVEQARFITIAGPSGSGKSSVARAGLFHALREGQLERSETWLLATMQPKGEPTEQLALAIDRVEGKPGTADSIREGGLEDPLALHKLAETLLTDDKRQRFVLLVDQFEELFTQTRDEEERSAFIDLLTSAVGVEDGRVSIVISLRSDFVSNCASYDELRALMSQEFQLVGAMKSRDLAKAITLPSLEVGAEIEPALVKQIIDDMKGEPGALPLMSFALRDLFEAQKTVPGEPMDLTLEEYLQRGGIEDALERHANNVFESLTDEQQALAKGIFSKLINVSEGGVDTRRTATFEELVPAGGDPEAVTTVVGMLAAEGARLLTTSGVNRDEGLIAEGIDGAETAVTIAHEKLIEAWPWLLNLVDENREIIKLHNQISDDAKKWVEEKDTGYLYRGRRLAEVEEKLGALRPSLDLQSQQFVDSGIRRQHLIRRGFASAVIIAFLVSLGLAIVFSQQAERAILQSRRALAQSLLANSRAITSRPTNNIETEKARLLAVEGNRINEQVGSASNRTDGNNLLLTLAYDYPVPYRKVERIAGYKDYISDMAWNLDGSLLASASSNEIVIWDTLTWQPIRTLEASQSEIDLLEWNHDGSYLAALAGGTIIIWDSANWQQVLTLSDNTSAINGLAWNRDGSRLASTSCGGEDSWNCAGQIIIWDTETGESVDIITDIEANLFAAAWNKDGSQLAASKSLDQIIIWDTDTWQQKKTITHPMVRLKPTSIHDIAWSSDGSRLASAAGDIVIWDTETWEPVKTLTEHANEVLDVAWTNNGGRLASASLDGTAIVWDTETWEPIMKLSDDTITVGNVAWSGNSSYLATDSCRRVETNDKCQHEIIIWDTESWQPKTTIKGLKNFVGSVDWSPDGSRLASAGNEMTIWDTTNWQLLSTVKDAPMNRNIAWNMDGSLLATSGNGIAILDTTTWQKVQTLMEHTGDVISVAWNEDNSLLASASYDQTVIIWDTGNWEPHEILTDHKSQVYDVAWSKDGSRLASAGTDILVWDTETWQPIAILYPTSRGATALAWNGDGSLLASAESGGAVIIWDTETWQPIVRLTDHTWIANSLDWSIDGNLLASSAYDYPIIVWDTESWQRLTALDGHSADVMDIAWNDDGTQLASASLDINVIIWEFPNFERLNCRMAGRNLSQAEWEQFLSGEDYRCTCGEWPAGEGAPQGAEGCAN